MAGIDLRSSTSQSGASSGASLTPTATKTTAYTAAVGDLAMMNVPGGATALTLPTAPADKAQVAYRAIGATTAVPLVITAGGSDTIGTAGATTASIPLADEVAVLQYEAATGRWLGVGNVKTQASLDARYTALSWVASKTANYTAGRNEAVPVSASANNVTVTLPASPVVGDRVQVLRTDSTSNSFEVYVVGANGADAARTVSDATTAGVLITSATAAFVAGRDEGATVTGTNQAAGSKIVRVTGTTTAVQSTTPTATGASQTITITRPAPVETIPTQTLVTFTYDGTLWRKGSTPNIASVMRPLQFNSSSGNQEQSYDRIGNWPRKQRIVPTPASTVLHRFTTPASLTSSTAVTADPFPFYGGGNVRLTATSFTTAVATKTLASAVDLTNMIIRTHLRLTAPVTPAGMSKCYLELSSDNFAASGANVHRLTLNARSENLLVMDGAPDIMSAHVGEFTVVGTGAALSAVNAIRFTLARDSGVDPLYLDVAVVEAVPVVATKAKAVLCFDDGYTGHWQYAAPAMAAYGFPGVAFPNITQADAMTGEQMRALQDMHGWQIGTHAYSNAQHGELASGDDIRKAMMMCKAVSHMFGLGGSDDFAYYGSAGPTTDRMRAVRTHHRSGRMFLNQCRLTETLPPGNPSRFLAYGYTGGDDTSQTTMQSYVDRAIAQKGLATIVYHNITSATLPASLTWLLAYLDTNRANIDVVTFDTAFAPYSTPA